MLIHERAGWPATPSDLIDVAYLVSAYYALRPDVDDIAQRVAFGTSGHRGSSVTGSFNEAHIAATTQAICEHRAAHSIGGPLFLARDTQALSEPAWATALEVLAANDVTVLIDADGRYTPTPAISHAVLRHNGGRTSGSALADGIVVTPSHNPPKDGGFKYNAPHGGPADTDATGWIASCANYVDDLSSVLDLDAIRDAGVHVGADPLGGASAGYWGRTADTHNLEITVVNPLVDPTWRFMTLDWDGAIWMDCSSPHAMASLIGARDRYQIAIGNDADADRHGIVTPDGGLMNPNHFLAVAIEYLFSHRPGWPSTAVIGKTLVSSSMIDRVAAGLVRKLVEVPVGFKWFVPGLRDGSIGFGGEESAGASFLRHDGTVWTTDKDGILLALLASEILVVTGSSPSDRYRELIAKHGDPTYERIDASATREERAALGSMTPDQVPSGELAGEPITAVLTEAPGNGAPIGGLKVTTESSWFAAQPTGTEDVYKIYAESFRGPAHLGQLQDEARALVTSVLSAAS